MLNGCISVCLVVNSDAQAMYDADQSPAGNTNYNDEDDREERPEAELR